MSSPYSTGSPPRSPYSTGTPPLSPYAYAGNGETSWTATYNVAYAPQAGGVRASERKGTWYEPGPGDPVLDVAAVLVPGGGFSNLTPSTGCANLGRLLATRGYPSLDVRYRLVTGADAVVSRDCIADVALAVAYVLALPGIDRVVLIGHSTGGRIVQTLNWVRSYLAAVGLDPSDIEVMASLDAPTTFDEVPRPLAGEDAFWEAQPPRDLAGFAPSVLELHGDLRSTTPNDVDAPCELDGVNFDHDRFLYGGFDDEGNVVVSPTGLGTHEHLAAEPLAAPMLITFTREEDDRRADTIAALQTASVGHPRATVKVYEDTSTPLLNHIEMLTKVVDGHPMGEWLVAELDAELGVVR